MNTLKVRRERAKEKTKLSAGGGSAFPTWYRGHIRLAGSRQDEII
jgi:hypothetical protein